MTGQPPRVLVAGIGNIFLGDDAFGVEVARLLLARPQPPNVQIVDFGIRGLDLAYALTDGCDTAILIDAVPRGQSPGTLYVIEPEPDAAPPHGAGFDGHSMDPVSVLRLARTLGDLPRRVLIVGCEPSPDASEENADFELSEPVRAALMPAVDKVESLIERLASAPALPARSAKAPRGAKTEPTEILS
jgi:hydrogenase maturation protease